MYCSKCGEKMTDNVNFCPKCGNSMNPTQGDQIEDASGNLKKVKCPSCGGTNLQYITETNTKVESSGGYSGSKGCLGYLLLGPFGLLCGSCGSSKKTTITDEHNHFWVCSDCGCKFPTLEDLEAKIKEKKDSLNSVVPVSIGCAFLIILGLILDITLLTIMGGIFTILTIILVPLLKKQIQKDETEYAELEKKIKM